MIADADADPAELHRRGEALTERFESGGDPADLDLAVAVHRRAVELTEPDDDARSERLGGLGGALLTRFEQSEDPSDLVAALEVLQSAVESAHPGSAAEVEALSAFGSALQARYEYGGDLAVLEEAVAVGRRAAEVMAAGHPRLSTVQLDLGSALHLLFLRSGDVRDMDESIQVTTAAVLARPRPGAGRAAALSNLSAAYRVRFDRLGQRGDIETGLTTAREAVEAAPVLDPYRCGYLYNLSVALRTRYDAYGGAGDLDEAVTVAQQAAAAAPAGYPALPMFLSNVAGLLMARYRQRPATADLEGAVRAAAQAVEAAPVGHLHRAGYQSNLAVMLRSRYERLGRIEDLDESVRAGREAVDLTAPGDPARLRRLGNLSIALRRRHAVTGVPADLDEAVAAVTAAVEGTAEDDPARLGRLSTLAEAYQARYAVSGRPRDQEVALFAARCAADGTAGDHAARTRRLIAVAALLDDVAALPLLREAAGVEAASTTSRLDAALRWARCATRIGDRRAALDGYEVTVARLEQAVWPGLPFPDRIFTLGQVAGIAGDAAAAALDDDRPGRALLLLERARGLLYAHRLATDADRSVLDAMDSDLAGELLAVRRDLDETERLGDSADEVGAVLTGRGSWDRRRRLTARWEQLVGRARALPGLEDFLRPPGLESLTAAAGDGPVVVVNVSGARCDALIVTTTGVDLLPLPRLTLAEARRVAAGYLRVAGNPLRAGTDRNLRAVLAWLWDTVTAPVLDHLGLAHRDGPPWPRVWWCPTGPLAVLPMHAAGRYDAGALTEVGVLDRVVSSYTPTVSALAHARSRSRVPGDDAMLAVQASADLPHTGQEVDRIAGRVSPGRVDVLRGTGAGRAAVSAGMATHGWLHYAGHSRSDIDDPGASGLELADGRLTLRDIAALRLSGARFAYLSSCDSGAGSARLPDEVLHLCGAAQLAGYQRVVGTYWPITDRAAATVAAGLYERMDTGGGLDPGLAAEALHAVTRTLRDTHGVTTWAAYFHAGP